MVEKHGRKNCTDKKFKLIRVDEIEISDEEYPIIGTNSLGPCVGVLLYCPKRKKAIVAHIPDNINNFFEQIFNFILQYDLDNEPIKYGIISGFYPNGYNVVEQLQNKFQQFPSLFSLMEIPKDAVNINYDILNSHEFAFDALNGTFVTDKVFFGKEYYDIHEQSPGSK